MFERNEFSSRYFDHNFNFCFIVCEYYKLLLIPIALLVAIVNSVARSQARKKAHRIILGEKQASITCKFQNDSSI